MLAQFQALERDPRAEMAEFKYTRMGPLAMAFTLDAPPAAPTRRCRRSDGVHGRRGRSRSRCQAGRAWRAATPGAITVADLDGDGELDLFLANALTGDAPNAVVR